MTPRPRVSQPLGRAPHRLPIRGSLRPPRGRVLGGGLGGVLCAALLAGCWGGDSDADGAATTPAPTTAADGTTVPGTDLALGAKALVSFQAGRKASLVGLRVLAVRRGRIKDLEQFELAGAALSSTVYYVDVAVRNTGPADLGGQRVPMYGKVSDTLVVPPVVFGSTFAPCRFEPLPKVFAEGAKARVCMVMLAPKHGKVSAIQWRGTPAAPAPPEAPEPSSAETTSDAETTSAETAESQPISWAVR